MPAGPHMQVASRIIARGEWHWQDKRVKRSSAAEERVGIHAPPDMARGPLRRRGFRRAGNYL